MATPTDTIWEVRTTGSSTNSGGFAASLGGTDYSQQISPQYTLTASITIDGADNTKITSSQHNFVAADRGNTIRITGGVNFTTAVYMIINTSGNAAFLDRAVGTVGATGGSGNVGGCFDSLATMFAVNVLLFLGGNTIYIKSGTYSLASGASSSKAGTRALRIGLIGYDTTRGDNCPTGVYPQLQPTGGSFTALLTISGAYWDVRNMSFLGLNGGNRTDYGLQAAAGQAFVENCVSSNQKTRGFYVGADGLVIRNCWASFCGITTASNTTGGFYFTSGSGQSCEGCWATNCYIGFNCNAASPVFVNCVADTSSQQGFLYQNQCSALLNHCTIRTSGAGGILYQDAASGECPSILNTIIYDSVTYAVASTVTNYGSNPSVNLRMRYCAVGGTGSSFNQVGSGTDITTLSASPFDSAVVGNVTLNGTTGGGAACKNSGWPGFHPATTDQGYPDIGAMEAPPSISLARVMGGL